MNWSLLVVGLVPARVVTVTSTVPTLELGGAVAVILVSDSTVKLLAGTVPNLTALAALRFVPVIVNVVQSSDRVFVVAMHDA